MLWNTQSCLFLGKELISCKLSEWSVWLFHTSRTRKRVPLSSPGHPATKMVEIELLATVGWKCGCQPFSCPCSQNVTLCRKEICSTCLSKESIPAIPLGNAKHPLLVRSLRFPRAAAHSTSSALWLYLAHPFVAAVEKDVSHAEKQRVWSRSCRLHELYRFVTMQWLCSQLCYVTTANKGTMVDTELLATVGWKWGCQPFSCPCSQNVTLCRKEICSTCLSKEFMPFLKSQPPLLTRSLRSLRAAAHSTSSGLWLQKIPSLRCICRKNLSYAEKQMVWSRSCGLQDLLQWDCCKPTNTCRDWFFSNSGLEVWLPAFQLPMFEKWDSLPKGDLLDMVSGIHSRHSFGKCQASTPCQKLEVPESGSTLYRLCIMLALCLQKIPSLCWRFRICVSCREA